MKIPVTNGSRVDNADDKPIEDADNEEADNGQELVHKRETRVTEATGLNTARQRISSNECPYSLRRKITVPKRYQQARDDLQDEEGVM